MIQDRFTLALTRVGESRWSQKCSTNRFLILGVELNPAEPDAPNGLEFLAGTQSAMFQRQFGVAISYEEDLAAGVKSRASLTTPSLVSTAGKQTKAIVVTSGMLVFISFWRASAIVLCDLASTAYYIGGIVEQAIGKSAPVLHPRRDAVLVPDARGLRRVVLDVHPRRRISRRQRGDGLDAREVVGLRADVRLHPDRTHQRRLGGTIYCRSRQRTAESDALAASRCRRI